ncbi:MAG: ABC transporter ATP-binding protein [Chloroflexota bacterium]
MHILAPPEPLLRVDGLSARYGKIVVLHGVSFVVAPGEVVTLLGANGSGKTTVLNTLCGFLPAVEGVVTFDGERIDGLAPHSVFRHGIVQVSQERDLFPDMAVIDNLRLGAHIRREGAGDLGKVLARFPRLAERRTQRVRTLSGGEQQMVAIGRAMMSHPRILLLDEPSAGLAPRFVGEIGTIMSLLKQEGGTMLLVEQNLRLAAAVADRFYILRAGRIVHAGAGGELREDHQAFAKTYYL